MVEDNLPQVPKGKLRFYSDNKDEDWLDLIIFLNWLFISGFLLERFLDFMGERMEGDRRSRERDKRFSKASNFSASSNAKETKQMQSGQCTLVDSTHEFCNFP